VPSAPQLLPADDTGRSNTDNVTNRPQPRLMTGTGTLLAGEALPLRIQVLDAGGLIIGEADAVAGPGTTYTYTVQLFPRLVANQVNSLSIRTRAVDPAGNLGPTSAAVGLVIDLQAPPPPALTLTSDSGSSNTDNITNITNPTFAIGNVEGGTVVELLRNGTVVASRTIRWARPGRRSP
jgi:hypothetical protein